MIVVCPACQARFRYDETRFGGLQAKRFNCPRCDEVFAVANPTFTGLPNGAQPPLTLGPTPPTATPLGQPIPPAPLPSARTTAKRGHESMLVETDLQVAGMPPGLRFSLAFLSGPQASTGQVLEQPLTLIGREEGDVITRDPETSRRHAQLVIRRDGTVWISDQQSTNGTLVDGKRISGTIQLNSQQEFTCGNSTFKLLIQNIDDLAFGCDSCHDY